MKTKAPSQIISKVLSPALKLWLRSQVEQMETLQIQIQGSDRQILGGHIPEVFLTSADAVYQGLHLKKVQVRGENIRINLAQVLKGKALRLLEPILIRAEVMLGEADIRASLGSPLLASGLTDLLIRLLNLKGVDNPKTILESYQLNWQEVNIYCDKLTLSGTLTNAQGEVFPLLLRTGLSLANSHTLRLYPLCLEGFSEVLSISFNDFELDLGSEVNIEDLRLELGQLICVGCLTVISE